MPATATTPAKAPKILPAKTTPLIDTVVKPTPIGAARYQDGDIITLLSPTNPKKVGSQTHGRFKLYGSKPGDTTTVGAFLKAGGHRIDLPWDSNPKRGFIRIDKAQ
jgi:hypothetical protein